MIFSITFIIHAHLRVSCDHENFDFSNIKCIPHKVNYSKIVDVSSQNLDEYFRNYSNLELRMKI